MATEPTKTCPFCAETISNDALRCPYCGSNLPSAQSSAPQYPGNQAPQFQQPMPPFQQQGPYPQQNPFQQQGQYSQQGPYLQQGQYPQQGPYQQQGPYPQQPMQYRNPHFIPHPEQLQFQRINYQPGQFTTPYVMMLIGSLLGGFVAGIGMAMFQNGGYQEEDIGGLLIFIGIILVIVGVINGMMLVYRCWVVIQDGHAQTTPGKAVGYLFIPIYNLYWMFIAYYGLANDMNSYIRRYGMRITPCNNGLVLFNTILSVIPYVNYITALTQPFAMYTLMRTARDIQQAKRYQMSNRR